MYFLAIIENVSESNLKVKVKNSKVKVVRSNNENKTGNKISDYTALIKCDFVGPNSDD